MNKFKSMARLLTVLPLVLLLVITNIYQDPAFLYHDESMAIAQALINGYAAYSTSGNLNDRQFKKKLISLMPAEPDCVAVGPSLVMCVNKDIVGTDSFYNLGVSGADLYDILAQFGAMEIDGKKPKRVIFCVDFYFFDDLYYSQPNLKHTVLMSYSEHMLSLLNHTPSQPIKEDKLSRLESQTKQAFSVTYYQAACNQIVKNRQYILESRWKIVADHFDGSTHYYCPDGSLTYSDNYQANNVDSVRAHCAAYGLAKSFCFDRHISEYSVDVFEKLIAYLIGQGTEVELFLCPIAPDLWDRLQAEHEHYIFSDEMTEMAHSMAQKYHLKLTGSYNPYEVGITNADFYDARHIRREVLDTYFDFTG